MNLNSYLVSKKIDADALLKKEPELYRSFEMMLDQMHPDSFTAQKLFVINKLRRQFPFQEKVEEMTPVAAPKAKPRPVLKVKKQD